MVVRTFLRGRHRNYIALASAVIVLLSCNAFLLYLYHESVDEPPEFELPSTKAPKLEDPVKVPHIGQPPKKQEPSENQCKCLSCAFDANCGGLWTDDVSITYFGRTISPDFDKISMVISQCSKDNLDWVKSFVKNHNVSDITVISKCGKEVSLPFEDTKLIELPNVGRCDHSYAYYINQIYNSSNTDKELIFFMKDDRDRKNLKTGMKKSLLTMLVNAQMTGFACGLTPQPRRAFSVSSYHHTGTIQNFSMKEYLSMLKRDKRTKYPLSKDEVFESPYGSLGSYMKAMDYSFPPNLTNVCYGGWFAATREAIQRQPQHVWQNLEKSLSRANNLEEGHFAERSWAGLLSKPLEQYQVEGVVKHAHAVLMVDDWLQGPLVRATSGIVWKEIWELNTSDTVLGKPKYRRNSTTW